VLAVTVYDLPPLSSAADVESLVRQVLATTSTITAAIGGTGPDLTTEQAP
jgi:hypothetical protein